MALAGIPTKHGQHKRTRRHPGIRGRRPDLKANRIDTAKERSECRDTLTDEQQLAALDRRLGKGVGAKRERARLAIRIGRKAAGGKARAA